MTGGGDDRVVVVGAGILGCSIAVHLVDRGVRPVVIDPDRPGQGTSTGSFASISAFGKDPVAWFQLACAGVSGWPRFAGRIGGDVGLRRAGEVRVADDPEAGRRPARQVAVARGRGYPVRLVDAGELARLLPTARVGQVTAASFAPNDGQVEPPLVLAACRRVLAEAGVRFLTGRARVRLDDDGVRVEAGSQVLRPETCVLAAGAEAVQVAAAVGLQVPTVSSPGLLAQTRPLAPLTDRVVYVPGGPGPAVHLRQRADGSVLVGERTQETLATNPGLAQGLGGPGGPVLAAPGRRRGGHVVAGLPADAVGPATDRGSAALAGSAVCGCQPQRGHPGPGAGPADRRRGRHPDQRRPARPFRPARFAERTTGVMLEVESVFRDPARQDRST